MGTSGGGELVIENLFTYADAALYFGAAPIFLGAMVCLLILYIPKRN